MQYLSQIQFPKTYKLSLEIGFVRIDGSNVIVGSAASETHRRIQGQISEALYKVSTATNRSEACITS